MKTMNKALLILAASMTAFVADSATVYKADLNTLDLDLNPQVVTNVTFDGLDADLTPATNYTDLATNELRKSLSIITTNDVCNIVTNEIVVSPSDLVWPEEWYGRTYTENLPEPEEGYTYYTVSKINQSTYAVRIWVYEPVIDDWIIDGDYECTYTETDTTLTLVNESLPAPLVATKTTPVIQNALGLARLIDLPQLTNGLISASTATNIVNSATKDIHVMSESNGLVRGVAIGLRSEASGTSSDGNMQSVAIGPDSLASGGASLAVGSQIRAIGERSIAIGYGNDVGVSPSPRDSFGAMGTASIAIGDCASASNEYSTAVGFKSKANNADSTAIGFKAKAEGEDGVAIGSYSESLGAGSIAVGGIAGSSSASRSTSVGNSSKATNSQSVAIGAYAVAGGQRSVAIGGAASANSIPTKAAAIRSTAIGAKAVATASDAVQIGDGENAASGTLQFRGFRVIESDGKIPADRIPDSIFSTNNAAFVAAVTNCPVAIAASDAEALTEWGIYGGGGTIGVLLAALAAAVAALRRDKAEKSEMSALIPMYTFDANPTITEGTVSWEYSTNTVDGHVITDDYADGPEYVQDMSEWGGSATAGWIIIVVNPEDGADVIPLFASGDENATTLTFSKSGISGTITATKTATPATLTVSPYTNTQIDMGKWYLSPGLTYIVGLAYSDGTGGSSVGWYPVDSDGNQMGDAKGSLNSESLTWETGEAYEAFTATRPPSAFKIAVGALPTGVTGKVRDCILVIDCTETGAVAPTVTWGSHFHPRTDTATDLAIVEAGKRAVFYISEYASGEFAVGGWQETEGGSGT